MGCHSENLSKVVGDSKAITGKVACICPVLILEDVLTF